LGSSWIDTEHLLLGILREDPVLRNELPAEAIEQVRKEIKPRTLDSSRPHSRDLPLSAGSKQALAFGAEEADQLGHRKITAGHLLLGLLRLEDSIAADLLRPFGIEIARYRDVIKK
jgi:ATP-dependent Clp protease ATP-binding subunit ClpC